MALSYFCFCKNNWFYRTRGLSLSKIIFRIDYCLLSSLYLIYLLKDLLETKKINFPHFYKIFNYNHIYYFIINSVSIFKKGFEKSHFPEIIVNTYKTLGYRSSFQNNIACHSRIGENGFIV